MVPFKSIFEERLSPTRQAKVDRNWKCVAWALSDLKESQVDWWRQGRRFGGTPALVLVTLESAESARWSASAVLVLKTPFAFLIRQSTYDGSSAIHRDGEFISIYEVSRTHYMIARESFSAECVVMFSPLLNFTSNGSWSVFAVEFRVELQKIYLKIVFLSLRFLDRRSSDAFWRKIIDEIISELWRVDLAALALSEPRRVLREISKKPPKTVFECKYSIVSSSLRAEKERARPSRQCAMLEHDQFQWFGDFQPLWVKIKINHSVMRVQASKFQDSVPAPVH